LLLQAFLVVAIFAGDARDSYIKIRILRFDLSKYSRALNIDI
jgi:hypothetical protein